MAAKERIYRKLLFLYGENLVEELTEKLFSIIDAYPKHTASTTSLPLSEKDVVLITYGDQIQDTDATPLAAQHRFLLDKIHPVINSVHILPFYPYSSDDGFSVIDYYAVEPTMGTWEDVSRMGQDFNLMFDAVFNHISAKSDWFQAFLRDEEPYKDYFVVIEDPSIDLSAVVRPRALPLLTEVETPSGKKHVWTTFSDDQIDLNIMNPDVLFELIRILLFYVDNGAKLIRLDAIAFMWKIIGTDCIHLEQTHVVIQIMRDVLTIVAPDVVLITETNVPHEENISYFGDGTNEAHMVYQFPLPPLTLHTLTSGDASKLTQWAASLEQAGGATAFFNFTASHDGIGLRPVMSILDAKQIQQLVDLASEHGGNVSYKNNSDGSQSPYELNISYFDAITHPDVTESDPQTAINRFIVSQAIPLALAGVPGIYFHSLFGSRNWKDGVKETGRFRTINRKKLQLADIQNDLQGDQSIRSQVYNRYYHLLDIRRKQKAFHPLAEQNILTLSDAVFAVERIHENDHIVALYNVTDKAVTVDIGKDRNWTDLITGGTYDTSVFDLAPYQILWLKVD